LTRVNEFPRPISVADLPEEGEAFEVSATPEERRALAERLGLLALDALVARGRLEPMEPGGLIRLSGTLEASATQECVVSLQPVAATLREPLLRCFRLGPPVPQGDDAEVAVELEEEVEPLPGDVVDVGEIAAEELALALDPYPRAPAAEELVAGRLGPKVTLNAPEERHHPFAALRGRAR
jgi:uncharacterized metal-binding protein YceD (DUF177 family)